MGELIGGFLASIALAMVLFIFFQLSSLLLYLNHSLLEYRHVLLAQRYLTLYARSAGYVHCHFRLLINRQPLRVYGVESPPSFVDDALSDVLVVHQCSQAFPDRLSTIAFYIADTHRKRYGRRVLALYKKRQGGYRQEIVQGIESLRVTSPSPLLSSLQRQKQSIGHLGSDGINLAFTSCAAFPKHLFLAAHSCHRWMLWLSLI